MRLPTVHVTGQRSCCATLWHQPGAPRPRLTFSPPCQDLTSCYFFVLLLVFDWMLFVLDNCKWGKSYLECESESCFYQLIFWFFCLVCREMAALSPRLLLKSVCRCHTWLLCSCPIRRSGGTGRHLAEFVASKWSFMSEFKISH